MSLYYGWCWDEVDKLNPSNIGNMFGIWIIQVKIYIYTLKKLILLISYTYNVI